MFKGPIGIALAAVAGAAVLVVGVAITVPAARRVLRPALKTALKGAVAASIAVRRHAAELGEAWDDLVAEVSAEMAGATAASVAAAQEAKPEKPAPRKRRARKAA